eukprot:TRINITY_DN133908_c0_g1_i1.p1 TRINITY_DN133908_c0_g1~~TRINITY_DN133908_c0_g1_i1.p1  ORF type:complete len:118 (-),score=30.79 TRINITY_DN133908_c0_g1_i1:68-421(-)
MNHKVGAHEFRDKGFLDGQLLVDEEMVLWKKYAPKMGLKATLHALTTMGEVSKLEKEGIDGNFEGASHSSKHLDAIYIVSGGNGQVVFKHLYKLSNNYPNWPELVDHCKKAAEVTNQ